MFTPWSHQFRAPENGRYSDQLVLPQVPVHPASIVDFKESLDKLDEELDQMEREYQDELASSQNPGDIIQTISAGISRTLEKTLIKFKFGSETESEDESETISDGHGSESFQSRGGKDGGKVLYGSDKLNPVVFSVLQTLKSDITSGAYREAYSIALSNHQALNTARSVARSDSNQPENGAESAQTTARSEVETSVQLRRRLRKERNQAIMELLEAARKEANALMVRKDTD